MNLQITERTLSYRFKEGKTNILTTKVKNAISLVFGKGIFTPSRGNKSSVLTSQVQLTLGLFYIRNKYNIPHTHTHTHTHTHSHFLSSLVLFSLLMDFINTFWQNRDTIQDKKSLSKTLDKDNQTQNSSCERSSCSPLLPHSLASPLTLLWNTVFKPYQSQPMPCNFFSSHHFRPPLLLQLSK